MCLHLRKATESVASSVLYICVWEQLPLQVLLPNKVKGCCCTRMACTFGRGSWLVAFLPQASFLEEAFLVSDILGYPKACSFLVSHAKCKICNDKLCISWEATIKHELFFLSSLCPFLSCTLGFIMRDASLHRSPCSLREGRIIFSFPPFFFFLFSVLFSGRTVKKVHLCAFFFCIQSSFVTVANVCRMKLAFLVAQ